MIKGKGQRLIPEELLKYLEIYKENHPDPAGGGGATIEDIVDSNNHKRFVEGNGAIETVAGLSSSYLKWSLSGTHIMFVFAGKLASGYGLGQVKVCSFEIPEWILNKIYPVWANKNIERKNMTLFEDSGQGTVITLILSKEDNKIYISVLSGTGSASKDRYFRFQFDLLIDADYS